MENHPFLRSLVAEGGPSGTGRLATTSANRSDAGERFDAKLSNRLREREAAGERVEDRRETLSATRERREARSERSERRNRSAETTESSSSTQATDEVRERDRAQGEVEAGAAEQDTQAEPCTEACNEPTAERATDAARTEAKPAKAARGETPTGAAQAEGEQAPATETLGVQLGQGKGLESHAKLAPKPNVALEGANEAVDAPQGELAVEGAKDYATLSIRIENSIKESQLREQSVLDLWESLSERQSLLNATPNIRPAKGWFTSRFGYRVSPFTGRPALHAGLDIAAAPGAPVYAPADGVVTFAGYDEGYGKMITLDHGYGVTTRFGHNAQIYVQVGQKVSRWDVISSVGNTGRSTGPHVHYEVRVNGVPRDPALYILDE